MIELDLSKHSFGALAPWLPSGLWVTIACCVVLGIVAWACAWRGVRRSEKASDLEIFIAFPFTHLFFMPFFIWRDWKSARPSVTVYMSIIVVWWFGGFFTQHIEQTKLDQLIAEMEANGEFLQYPKNKLLLMNRIRTTFGRIRFCFRWCKSMNGANEEKSCEASLLMMR